MDKARVPTILELAWPTLKVLESLGGCASNEQIAIKLAESFRLPDEVFPGPQGGGGRTELEDRAAWARTDLKRIGAVENRSRGVWCITDLGRRVPDEKSLLEAIKKGPPPPGPNDPDEPPTVQDDPRKCDKDWRDEVLGLLRSMDPKSFIGLCNQVLEESGFRQVEIIDKTGNGDILGSGVARINLVSFHILFQFKRSSTPVDGAEIRDLRGAMVGRAEKGLFVTTGKFTDSASQEAVRSGAPVIDLISGTEFCDLLKDLELGVSTTKVEVIGVDPEYFRNW